MLFKFKKFYSFVLAFVLSFTFLAFFSGASAKVRGDCIFSVGPACRPAQWLRKTSKRFQASPFDWMMKYSLDTVIHCFKNKFSDFFEDAEATGEVVGSQRVVRDRKNGIVSMHHFSKYVSLQDDKKDVRAKMIRRGKRVDKILKKSNSIILICNRQRDSLDDFKKFIRNFSKLYPDRNITLINIHSDNNSSVRSTTLYSGVAATKRKKKKVKVKPVKKNNNSTSATKKTPEIKTSQESVKASVQPGKEASRIKSKSGNKKPVKKKRKKLRIIQYSFNDASSSWEGNPYGWQQVMNDIELTDKNFDKNMDFKKVEF